MEQLVTDRSTQSVDFGKSLAGIRGTVLPRGCARTVDPRCFTHGHAVAISVLGMASSIEF